jgi:hypothetical protein
MLMTRLIKKARVKLPWLFNDLCQAYFIEQDKGKELGELTPSTVSVGFSMLLHHSLAPFLLDLASLLTLTGNPKASVEHSQV